MRIEYVDPYQLPPTTVTSTSSPVIIFYTHRHAFSFFSLFFPFFFFLLFFLVLNMPQIVPLLSWGQIFNYSIWHVKLEGVAEIAYVQKLIKTMDDFRETEVIRLCLKHFRQRNMHNCFEQLHKRSKIQLEHSSLTGLYETLVTDVSKKTLWLHQPLYNDVYFHNTDTNIYRTNLAVTF